VQRSASYPKIAVTAGGRGGCSHVGSRLLADVAAAAGVGEAFDDAVGGGRQRRSAHVLVCPAFSGRLSLCYFMLRAAGLDIRCGPRGVFGRLMLSGIVADYRRFQYCGQYLVSLLFRGRIDGAMHPLVFESREKGFGQRIVVTTPGAAQGLPHMQRGECRGEFC
jgi:hypothetical protein